jgi:type VI secretion system protein ImpG
MDQRLLNYYNRELQYVRELGGEFARQFPKIAGRLGLDAFECADPYVERLLEGFAFLSARIHLKLDAEFPRFTEHLLEMVYPHYLSPTPSIAVVQFQPNQKQGTLLDGFVIPRDTVLRSNVGKGEQTPCEYRTAHEVTLWPVEIASVTHSAYVSDLGELHLASRRQVKASLKIRLKATGGVPFEKIALDKLTLFIRGQDQLSFRLYELLLGAGIAVIARPPDRSYAHVSENDAVLPRGFRDEDALLPFDRRSFQGYRLLHEYFALPSRFLFVELGGLAEGIRRCKGSEIELVVLLDRHDAAVEAGVSEAAVQLFSAPAVNLFPRRADRIHLSDTTNEYHVVPDRTRPMDLEVHSITDVVGYGTNADVTRTFLPFYQHRERSLADEESAYFTVHRQTRLTSSRQKLQGPRSTYAGGETFIALVDGREGPYRSSLRQLAISTLCTNRDLPLQMAIGQGKTDFHLESGAPVAAVRCLAGPSPPRASHAWGETTWRLVSHLSLNYLSISEGSTAQGAAALRELLHLYGDLTDAHTKRQIDGVRTVQTTPIVRRVTQGGPVGFARGLEVTLDCDEAAFEGASVFLLGSVLEQFFAKYVSINSFTETVLRSAQRGEIMRWPARIGRRPAL